DAPRLSADAQRFGRTLKGAVADLGDADERFAAHQAAGRHFAGELRARLAQLIRGGGDEQLAAIDAAQNAERFGDEARELAQQALGDARAAKEEATIGHHSQVTLAPKQREEEITRTVGGLVQLVARERLQPARQLLLEPHL